MDTAAHRQWAEALARAYETREALAPLTEVESGLSVIDAYRIQQAWVALRQQAGARIVGRKVGLTSKAMQDLLGVNEPDYGHLLDDMIVPPGQPVRTDRLLQPRVEGEIAFVLQRDLSGESVTVPDVLAATAGVLPAIEIIDSRIRDWKLKLQDTVADNGSSGLVVLGSRLTPVDAVDLPLLGMTLSKNGELANTGAGAAVLGHPAAAVAWLAMALTRLGSPLQAGEIVLAGALTAAVPVAAGDNITVAFERLGSVSVRFV